MQCVLMCIWIERDEQGLEGEGEKEVGGGVVTDGGDLAAMGAARRPGGVTAATEAATRRCEVVATVTVAATKAVTAGKEMGLVVRGRGRRRGERWRRVWPGDTDKLGQLVMLSTELGNRSGDEGELCGVEEHAQRGELRSLADEVQKTAIAHVDSTQLLSTF